MPWCRPSRSSTRRSSDSQKRLAGSFVDGQLSSPSKDALNISQAAKHLHVSQPPLSRQIRDLEQELGTALFDRAHKKLKLTPAGQYFVEEARKIISHAKRAARAAKAAGAGHAGEITIGFLSPLGGMFLPSILHSFRKKFPLVDMDLAEMVPREQLEALLDSQIDLAFVAAAEVQSAKRFCFRTSDAGGVASGAPAGTSAGEAAERSSHGTRRRPIYHLKKVSGAGNARLPPPFVPVIRI